MVPSAEASDQHLISVADIVEEVPFEDAVESPSGLDSEFNKQSSAKFVEVSGATKTVEDMPPLVNPFNSKSNATKVPEVSAALKKMSLSGTQSKQTSSTKPSVEVSGTVKSACRAGPNCFYCA
jgi:hypothetical protein